MAIGDKIDTALLTRTFGDEFDSFSHSADGTTGVWKTTYAWGNRTLGSNGEQQYYSDSSVGVNPFSLAGGVLDIKAAPGPNPLGLPYNSGAITTETSFSQLYGYFEIRMQLPAGQGLWPAFWLLPADRSWPPELDIVESLGHEPTKLYFSTHSTTQATQGTTLNVADVSKGFHTYGAMWSPTRVRMYIDGTEVADMPTPADMHKPMYMLANLAVGGYWPGSPNASTPFPAHMQIDYIHAYAYPGTTGGAVTVTQPGENVGSTNAGPTITAPKQITAVNGTTIDLPGLAIADTWPGGTFSVTLSGNRGLLAVDAVAGVVRTGSGTTSVTLTGALSAINAALATATYKATAAGEEYLWLSATDPQGVRSVAPMVAGPGSGATPAPVVVPPPITPVVVTPSPSAPVLVVPDALTVAAGAVGALAGVTLSGGFAPGDITVVISDNIGLIRSTSVAGVVERGEGSTSLTLTGSLASINAEIASLTYQAGTQSGTEWLWISATDSRGTQVIKPVIVSIGATVTAPGVTPPLPAGGASIVVPGTATIAAGATAAISGIRIAGSMAPGDVTVVISDNIGRLHTAPAQAAAVTGEGSTSVKLIGSLDAVNVELAGLTYRAGDAGGREWLWVSVTDAKGVQLIASVIVDVAMPAGPAPAVPPPTPPLVISTPSSRALVAGTTAGVPGIKVSGGTPDGLVTVTVSDSLGRLQTNHVNGVVEQGQNTTSLTLKGGLAAVNAQLASLTYRAADAPGTDWLWISATDARGVQISSPVVMTFLAPSAPIVPVREAALQQPAAAPLSTADISASLGLDTLRLAAQGANPVPANDPYNTPCPGAAQMLALSADMPASIYALG